MRKPWSLLSTKWRSWHDASSKPCWLHLAELFSNYEAKLTAGYSQSYSKGTNAGVTVATTEGQHATVTAGKLSVLRVELTASDLSLHYRTVFNNGR